MTFYIDVHKEGSGVEEGVSSHDTLDHATDVARYHSEQENVEYVNVREVKTFIVGRWEKGQWIGVDG